MEYMTPINPSTEEQLLPIPCTLTEDVSGLVTDARQAQPEWARIPYDEKRNFS